MGLQDTVFDLTSEIEDLVQKEVLPQSSLDDLNRIVEAMWMYEEKVDSLRLELRAIAVGQKRSTG
jgi:hypothetical protein